ncbi:MAG: hypothetical protein H6Q04_757 [Acidobacteria bacterium]|nr:hypothetical protein [Acidobacteriota bacterium]
MATLRHNPLARVSLPGFRQVRLGVMLNDDHGVRIRQAGLENKSQQVLIGLINVWGIQENDIRPEPFAIQLTQALKDVELHQPISFGNSAQFKVSPDQLSRLRAPVNENNRARSPAEGLDAYGPGARKSVHKDQAGQILTQNVKKGLLEAVPCGAQIIAFGRVKPSPSHFPGNDPYHDFNLIQRLPD